MLNSVSVGIRGVLLVFVDNRGNFGTTDICEIILVYQMKDYVQKQQSGHYSVRSINDAI